MTRTYPVNPAHVADTVDWRWYTIGKSLLYPGAWVAVNRATNTTILCSSESAALRIVELAYALKHGHPKPHNHKTLEQKARVLENVNGRAARYFTWGRMDRPLAYATEAHDVSLLSDNNTSRPEGDLCND